MESIVTFLLRWRKAVVSFVIVVTLLLAASIIKVELNTDFSTYLSKDDPIVKEFNRIGEVFGSNDLGMVIVQKDNLFTIKNLKEIKELTEEIKALDGITQTVSITEVYDMNTENFNQVALKPLPKNEQEITSYKEYIYSQELFNGSLVNEKGDSSVILVGFAPDANHIQIANKIEEVVQSVSDKPDQVYYGGMPFVMSAFQTTITSNLLFLLPAMILLLLGILYLGFRKISATLLPLLVVLISTVWLIGIMSLLGIPIDMLSGIVPVILMAMGSADAIHVIRRFYELVQQGESVPSAVKSSFVEMGKPIVLTTITTMVGFASLITSDFLIINQFGIVTTLGVFIALLITFLFLLPFLSYSKDGGEGERTSHIKENKFLKCLGDFVYYRKKLVVVMGIIVILLSAFGIPKIVSNVDWSLCFSKGSKPYQGDMILREEFNGSLFSQILVKGEYNDPITMEVMDRTGKYINTLPKVNQSSSLANIVKEVNFNLSGKYNIPNNKESLKLINDALQEQKMVEMMSSPNTKEYMITGKVGTMATADMSTSVEGINDFVEGNSGDWISLNIEEQKSKETQEKLKRKQREIVQKLIIWDLESRGISIEKEILDPIIQEASTFEELSLIKREEILGSLREDILANMDQGEDMDFEAIPSLLNHWISIAEVRELTKTDILNSLGGNTSLQLPDKLNYLISKINFAIGEEKVEQSYNSLKNNVSSSLFNSPLTEKIIKGDLWNARSSQLILRKDELTEWEDNLTIQDVSSVSLQPTGMVTILKKMEEELTPTQITSVLTALAFVFLILSAIFKSFRVGIIGIVPIIMTVLVNFGVIGYLKIGLDSFTAMIASIAIGLGIDYSIHFTSRFKSEYLKLKDEKLALKETLQSTGSAILINAISVGSGFAILLFAVGQHLQRFGGLLALALVVSALFTLTILPALTLLFKPGYMKD